MAENYRWNHPNGSGGFIPMNFATSAAAVSYGSSTVKEALDDFNESSGASSFMKTLLNAADATAARKILRVSREDFFDETGGRWDAINAILSAEESKFGTSSYYGNGSSSYLSNGAGITLGGKDFAIACWFYVPAASTTARAIFSWGNSSTRLAAGQNASNKFYWALVVSGSTLFSTASTAVPAGSWQHVEIDYRNSDNKLFLFWNGELIDTQTISELSTARTMPFMIGANTNNLSAALKGYIDEFLITEKLLHTANFTVPTSTYSLDSSTIALLHFE